MAIDFQVVFPTEVIKLNGIRLTPPSPLGLPTQLDILGEDFSSVDEVFINDMESPDVIVVSKNRLLAQLPDVLQKSRAVNSVMVLSRKLTLSPRSLIRFRIGDTPSRVSGILRLVQVFLKVLFTTPGTDIFSKRVGGGALTLLGETFGADEGRKVVSNFVVAVDTAQRQIIALQGRDPALPPDERLLSARVTRSGFNREQGAIIASVELTSQAGRAALANLEL